MHIIIFSTICILLSCTTPQLRGERSISFRTNNTNGKPSVSQSELQDDIQRFTSVLISRIVQTMEDIQNDKPANLQEEITRRTLLYLSNAFDIVTGSDPAVSLLDMIVFVRLNREVIHDYLIPEVYGDAGKTLLNDFLKSEEELWDIAAKVMTDEQKRKLIAVIEQWRKENPEQIRVESVRINDFSVLTGSAALERTQQARGLLSSVKSAVVSVDQALLIAEQALYLGQRMPFLLRMHVRLGVMELLTVMESQSTNVEALIDASQGIRPLLHDASMLVDRVIVSADEAKKLLMEVQPLIAYLQEENVDPEDLKQILSASNSLVEKVSYILNDLQKIAEQNTTDPVTYTAKRIDLLTRRIVLYLIVLGVAWALLGWGGYIIVRILKKQGKI